MDLYAYNIYIYISVCVWITWLLFISRVPVSPKPVLDHPQVTRLTVSPPFRWQMFLPFLHGIQKPWLLAHPFQTICILVARTMEQAGRVPSLTFAKFIASERIQQVRIRELPSASRKTSMPQGFPWFFVIFLQQPRANFSGFHMDCVHGARQVKRLIAGGGISHQRAHRSSLWKTGRKNAGPLGHTGGKCATGFCSSRDRQS